MVVFTSPPSLVTYGDGFGETLDFLSSKAAKKI